jgi:hypothetical protein
MEENKQAAIERTKISIPEDTVTINGKVVSRPFLVSMPRSNPELKILTDVLDSAFITSELSEYGGRDFVQAICYKITEYEDIVRNFIKANRQATLSDENKSLRNFVMLNQRLKLIDPDTEALRLWKTNDAWTSLNPPTYLSDYFKQRQSTKNIEDTHFSFWDELIVPHGPKHISNIAGFISWFYSKMMNNMHSDSFVPPVPLIENDRHKYALIKISDNINRISDSLYPKVCAYYLCFDANLFRDEQAIHEISDIISLAKNDLIIIKILGVKKIFEPGFGSYAKKNFMFFLKVLKDIKTLNPHKTIGLLDGGGFGYSIMGTGTIDFFTDTVSNFPQDSFARNTKLSHRGVLHPVTLTLERIDGIEQYQADHNGELFYNNSIALFYKGKNIKTSDRIRWSIDTRKMGLLMWQERMAGLVNSLNSGFGTMRFDEIVRSDYAILADILKEVTNG